MWEGIYLPTNKDGEGKIKPSKGYYSVEASPLIQKSNLEKQQTELLISNLIKSITETRKIEALKVKLSLQTDFNLKFAFQIFDKNKNGKVTSKEFKSGFDALGIEIYQDYIVELYLKSLEDED